MHIVLELFAPASNPLKVQSWLPTKVGFLFRGHCSHNLVAMLLAFNVRFWAFAVVVANSAMPKTIILFPFKYKLYDS